MFDKIVVALDGSELSEKALDRAIELGKQQQGELNLLNVIKYIPTYLMGEMSLAYRDYSEDLTKVLSKEGEELLNKAKEKAEAQGVTVTTHVIIGDPAREILDFSHENGVQLIVMGSRGLGALKEILLGSVSHRVSQLAECPVLIVK